MNDHKLSLVIGDQNLSSWSMRPWLVLKASGLPFQTVKIHLDRADTARKIRRFSPTGKVPLLRHGRIRIWDSLAICEYVNELAPNRCLWPTEPSERGRARSYVAEMHSGFSALRNQLSMDLRLRIRILHLSPDTVHDIERVIEIWEECLRNSKGPFLFGSFGIVDAFFAPVVFRFQSYGVEIRNRSAVAYMKQMQRQPGVVEWLKGARRERPQFAHFS